MSNTTTQGIQLGTFYSFLNLKGIHNGDDMVREMDGLGAFAKDEIVVLGEFQTFMHANWDCFEGQTLTNEDILKFWGNMNINHSASQKVGGHSESAALNDSELEGVEKQLVVYDVLNNFMESSTINSLCSQLNSIGLGNYVRDFKNSVNKSLMETCQQIIRQNPNASVDQIRALIQQALNDAVQMAANKTVANLIAQDEIKLLNLQIPGVDYSEFSEELQGLINTYIQQRLGSGNFSGDWMTIRNEVLYIINTYYQNAGVNTIHSTPGVSQNDLPSGCFITQGMSGLQIAMAKSKINQALASMSGNWGDVSSYFDHYAQLYIGYLTSSKSYNEIMAMTDAQIQGDIESNTSILNGMTIKTAMDLHSKAQNLKTDAIFISCLTGGNSAVLLTLGRLGNHAISTQQVYDSVDSDAADTYKNFCDTYNNGQNYSYGYTLAQANDILTYLSFDNSVISQIQNAIMSGSIKNQKELYDYAVQLIKQNMGNIGGSTPSSTQSIREMNQTYNTEYNNIINSDITGEEKLAQVKQLSIYYCDAACLKGDVAKKLVTDEFTTDYSSKINSYTLSNVGELTRKMSSLRTKLAQIETSGDINENVTGTTKIDAVSIDWNLMPAEDDLGWTKCKKTFMSKIDEIGTKLEEAAKKDGYGPTRAKNAKTTFHNYYSAAMDQLAAYGSTGTHHLYGGKFSYEDKNLGTTETSADQSRVCGNKREGYVDDAGNLGYSSGSDTGIFLGVNINNNGTHGYTVFVSPSKLRAKFKAFLH